MAKKQELKINEWNEGMSDSYLGKFTQLQNLDVTTIPGVARLNLKTTSQTPTMSAVTFTANAAQDIIDLTASRKWITGTPITFTTTGTLPNPLAASTTYYAIRFDNVTYKVASSYANAIAGTEIDITDTGTGTHSVLSLSMKLITKFVRADKLYGIDDDNVVWYYDTDLSSWCILGGFQNGGGTGNGIEYWKDYLFVFRSTTIDVWGPLSGSPSWTTSWKTISADTEHFSLVGQDDALYFASDNFVGSIIENVGQTFDPSTAATFTFNAEALDLPSDYSIDCLSELGQMLMIGSVHAYKELGAIFPWNRLSDSFNAPLFISEKGIYQMITDNNLLYFCAGKRGRFFVTDGVTVQDYFKISESSIGLDENTDILLTMYPNAVTKIRNKFFFGVSAVGTLEPLGIYSATRNGKLVFENEISTGNSGGTDDRVDIGALYSTTSPQYYISWRDASNYGIDLLEQSKRYDSSQGLIETGLFKVGTNRTLTYFEQIEIVLAKELATGQSVTISYRTNLTDSFIEIGSISYATDGAVARKTIDYGFQADYLQFQIVLDTNSNAETSPELIEINIK